MRLRVAGFSASSFSSFVAGLRGVLGFLAAVDRARLGFSSGSAAGSSAWPPPALARAASTLACRAESRSVMLSLSSDVAVATGVGRVSPVVRLRSIISSTASR